MPSGGCGKSQPGGMSSLGLDQSPADVVVEAGGPHCWACSRGPLAPHSTCYTWCPGEHSLRPLQAVTGAQCVCSSDNLNFQMTFSKGHHCWLGRLHSVTVTVHLENSRCISRWLIQSILGTQGFCICEVVNLLKFICDPQISTWGTFVIIDRHTEGNKNLSSSGCT